MTADTEALNEIRRLDPRALAELHDRHFAELYRYARFRLGDPHAAEDITSETFVRLLEALRAGRGPRTSPRGWLFGTLRHLVDDHFRSAYGRPAAGVPIESLVENGPDRQVEEAEQRARVAEAMRRLTGEQQHVLALRFGGGHSLEETAELMGRNSNAVKALQFRALASLRRHIGRETP